MRSFAFVLLAAAAGFAATAAHAQGPGGPPQPEPETVADPACAALATPGLFKTMTVTSAVAYKLGAGSDCDVKATLSPVPGSKIGVVFRLPKQWNGRVVGYGGGGWAGNVGLQTVRADLERGYATMQTDGGHPGANAFDAAWTAPGGKPDAVALNDFSWRAVHEMTVTGKLVAAKYYGRPEDKAIFVGCSTGGRMGLMEAQRFPNDYDGIVAGAPVYSLRVQLAEIWRDRVFAATGAQFTPAQLTVVHNAVLAQCDALDGVKDGVIGDPAACKFDPASIRCKAGQASGCITEAQVAALNKLYTEQKGPDGLVYAYPYSRGSEPGWPTFQNTVADPERAAQDRDLGLRAIMFGDPNFKFADFVLERDGPKARAGAFAKYYEADNPDLKPFLAKGKLILWHGLDDQGPSPWGTVAYNARMRAATGAAATANSRLFLAPGVLHCAGGPGPSQIDWLAAMDSWIKTGAAPAQIVASTPPAPPARPGSPAPQPVKMVSRPLCPYPAKARWDGRGDVNAAASFSCR